MRHDRASVYGAASASFRDPAGRVIEAGGRIVRLVERGHEAELLAALELPALGGFRTDGRVVGSRLMDRGEIRDLLEDEGAGEVLGDDIELALEHERIPFPSFAYEWSPAMLHAAAGLTLDLAEALLAEGFGLKDASPANVLFRGPRPVFVDVSSIERRDPHDPTWIPYGQFIRTFVMPLLLTKHLGLPLEQLTATRPDGLAPEEVYDYCGSVRRFLPPFLTVVSIPRWLRFAMPRTNPYRPRRVTDPAQARFIVGALLKQLRRLLRRVEPTGRVASRWSRYNDDVREERRGAQYVEIKRRFVEAALRTGRPRSVLDVGCNVGDFSALAAAHGARVVALDADPAVVDATWRRAARERLDFLPLVVDFSRPSPATGWRNRERAAFLDRARDGFDLILMLAVTHHLSVTAGIPLREILAAAADLTTDRLVIEFVAPHDPHFQMLAGGRGELFAGLTRELFERLCEDRFAIEATEDALPTRRLYRLRKREAAP